MKNIYLILILISFHSYSQNEQWHEYELDFLVKFKLPAENADLFNSEQNGIKMYELSAENNGTAYMGNKMEVEKLLLPNNLDELNSLYEDSMSEISRNYPETKENVKTIKRNGLIGRKYFLTNNNGKRLFESEVFLIKNHLYMFICLSKGNEEIQNSEYFFNQIYLPENSQMKQLTGKSKSSKLLSEFKMELLILTGIIALTIGIIVIKKNYLQQRI